MTGNVSRWYQLNDASYSETEMSDIRYGRLVFIANDGTTYFRWLLHRPLMFCFSNRSCCRAARPGPVGCNYLLWAGCDVGQLQLGGHEYLRSTRREGALREGVKARII